jgi:2',3'-cyclic-nucleotide 2'-phosphodiesterase (5'-nucleotidase family)
MAPPFRAALAVVLAVVLAACSKPEEKGPRSIIIAFTNNTQGEIRSCGCAEHDQGGLGRRMTLIEFERRGGKDFMLFDGGDLFSDTVNYALEKADLTLQSFRAMGYDAMVVGERDLYFGVDFLKDRAAALGVPVLAANLIDRKTNQPVFDATRMIDLPSGLRVGVIGVIEAVELPEEAPASDLEITDARAAVDALVPEVRDQGAELIVLLAHMPRSYLREWAQGLQGVDFIVNGHDPRPPKMPKQLLSGAHVMATTGRGRMVGFAYLDLDENDNEVWYDVRYPLLTKEYEDHEAIVKLFNSYDMDVREAEARKSGLPPGHEEKRFAGDQKCQPCHADIHAQWKETEHSHAINRLIADDRQYDRDCTPCHTTGFYEIGGFVSVGLTPDLVNVQCEACHGNAPEHIQNPLRKTPRNARKVCVTCHNEKQSPSFDFDEWWGKIRH